MIGIIDYGSGNLTSMRGAVEKLGFETAISADAAVLGQATKLILPGVGAFGDCMKNLVDRGLVETLNTLVMGERKPILGICAGAQLMCQSSDEFGNHEGLGWVPIHVRRIRPENPTLRVPHVGWNELERVRDSVLFNGLGDDALFYYVHSFAMQADDDAIVTGRCDYGGPFVATFEKANIYGTQFHPEKSQRAGLDLLRNFLERG